MRPASCSQVQVNGGMNPGNSGGPVTDARGVVIGVSVSGIRGTQINFAIPGDLVRQVLDGSYACSEFGAAYQKGDQALLPVKVTCLDPCGRFVSSSSMWGPARRARDNTVEAVYRDGTYQLEIPLPPPNSRRGCWIQPLITKSSGESVRGKAIPIPEEAQIVLERKPAYSGVQTTERRRRTHPPTR